MEHMNAAIRYELAWPPCWGDHIIRARVLEAPEARVRAHAGLFLFSLTLVHSPEETG